MKICQDEQEVLSYIKGTVYTAYKSRKLIPFIGAGFTHGETARQGNVPDGRETRTMMIKMICESRKEISEADLSSLEFQKVSNILYKYVPKNEIKRFLRSCFTRVGLSEAKKRLLSLQWPNIYTLNVDDGIENNSDYKPVLPYRSLNKDVLEGKVFKLHGDAEYEITYDDGTNIIFSRDQYVNSLINNQSILSCFQEDCLSHNFIYIGCSLENELDLEYVIKKSELSKSPQSIARIYVTTECPDFIKRSNLEDFGINTILVVPSYEFFYDELYKQLSKVTFDAHDVFDRYKQIQVSVNKNYAYNKQYLIATQSLSINSSRVEVPIFFSKRSISDAVVSNLDQTINIVVGKRLSGKTFLAVDIAQRIHNREVYFFPSDITLSVGQLKTLTGIPNAVLIFDTNVIGYEEMNYIAAAKAELQRLGISVIIFLNNSDRLLLSIPNRLVDCEVFVAQNKFDADELSRINDSLSRIGLIKFQKDRTIADNLFLVRDEYSRAALGYELSDIARRLTETDLKILILSAISDKVYSAVYRALQITMEDILALSGKLNKGAIIEMENTLDIEDFQHSHFKTVVNSKVYLFRLLGTYVNEGNKNIGQVVRVVHEIVSSLSGDPRFYLTIRNLTLFDNLNQIFWKTQGGVMNLIFKIYKKLEELLYRDNYYWIQRAKSIYYLKRSDENELLRAYEYAKKAYCDSKDSSNIHVQACFLISMVYGRLANLTAYRNEGYVAEAVDWYHMALQDVAYNHKHVKDLLQKARQDKHSNDFYALCSLFMRNGCAEYDKTKIEFLIRNLRND